MIDTSKITKEMTRDNVISLFGEPDATGGTSRKQKIPLIFLYGRIEISFGPRGTVDSVMDRGKSGRKHDYIMEPTRRNDEIVEGLCRVFKCKPDKLTDLVIAAKVMDSCFCDKPEDRLYHHSDNTWWKRVNGHLVGAEPPEGWVERKNAKH